MKTTIFMAVMAIMLLLSCQKSKRNTPEEPTLNITAPSGQQIATSTKALKEMTASMLTERFSIQQAVTITSINYLPVARGFAATIHFQLEDGMKGSYAVISEQYIKHLTPALPVAVESGDGESRTYMLVCSGPCQCRAYMVYNHSNNTLSWSCGCEECGGTIYSY